MNFEGRTIATGLKGGYQVLAADVNGDGRVDFGDINPYVEVLLQPGQATVEQRCAADINLDGWVDFGDINPFVALLTNP